MQISGIRALMAVRAALDAHGLVRTSGYVGGSFGGWTLPNHYDCTTMNIRPETGGTVNWHVVFSGKPHLRYRNYRRCEGNDDTIDLHEPISPEILCGTVAKAFRSLGLPPTKVEFSGASNHWDDDVSYNVQTVMPDWLAPPSRANLPPIALSGLTLCTFALEAGRQARTTPLAGVCASARDAGIKSLVGYIDATHAPLLTKEALDALAALPVRLKSEWRSHPSGGQSLLPATSASVQWGAHPDPSPDALVLRLLSDARGASQTILSPPETSLTATAETIRNAWDDEVVVWRFPAHSLARQQTFNPAQRFLLRGSLRDAVNFREWDAQFGPAPWTHNNPAATPGDLRDDSTRDGRRPASAA